MGIKLSNNAFGTLAAGINSSATSITLTTGQGARFPTLGAGDYFYATLIDTSNNLEIVKCTARSTDVLTVVRAQESTTARAYVTGDRIEIRLTAQTFIDAVNEIGPTQVSDEANSSTGYFDLPSGTTAQRPGSPTAGMMRVNSTDTVLEYYDGTKWRQTADRPYEIEYLVVAGGGSSGGGTYGLGGGGGGGAGGYLTGSMNVTPTTMYTATVGAGGSAVAADTLAQGNNGSNSQFHTVATAIGGGGGGYGSGGSNGRSGGSGGGQGYNGYSSGSGGGAGTSGQGYAGGNVSGVSASGAGGGGAGGAGASNTGSGGGAGGVGGAGVTWSDGVTYARGGDGGANSRDASEAANSGNGGNGVYNGGSSRGAGGSGVVIIRYAGTQKGSGGTVTSSGGYTYHTFTTSGTFTA